VETSAWTIEGDNQPKYIEVSAFDSPLGKERLVGRDIRGFKPQSMRWPTNTYRKASTALPWVQCSCQSNRNGETGEQPNIKWGRGKLHGRLAGVWGTKKVVYMGQHTDGSEI